MFGGLATAGINKPRMLIGGVVDYQIHQDFDATLVGVFHKFHEITAGAMSGIHPVIVRNIIASILVGGRLKGRKPDRIDSQSVQIVEPAGQSYKITYAVTI